MVVFCATVKNCKQFLVNAAGLAQAQTLDPVIMRPHAVRAERFCGGSVSDFPLSSLA